MKLTSGRGVHEHIMQMRNIAGQLESLEVEMSESFLLHFILILFYNSMDLSKSFTTYRKKNGQVINS